MYKPRFNQRKALRFRQFTRKRYALFACLGRVVTIGVLSAATLKSASAASRHVSLDEERNDTTHVTDKEATLDDIEITGTRAPLAAGQAARMVTVLSREDIQAAPVQSINDLLKMAVGVDVRQRGPIGAQTDVGIRGGTQEQMTILLNGINICDPQTAHNAFDLPCDISDIVRIEVLEGPAGRVYGTSSLAGAINVVTDGRWNVERGKWKEESGKWKVESGKRKEDGGKTGLQLRAEGGSYGYANLGMRYSPSTLHLTPSTNHSALHLTPSTSISTSYTRSDGYSRSKAGNLNSDYSGGKVFYQGAYADKDISLNWYAGLSTKGFGSNTFYSAKYDEQYEHTTKLYTALQGDMTAGLLHLRPAIYWNRGYDRFELIRGSEDKVPFNHHRTDVFGINLNSWFNWQLGRTAFGAEFRNEDIVSSNLGEPLNDPYGDYKYGLNRSNLSFHLEHNILLKCFTLSAGFIAVKNTWNQMPFTLYPGIDASYRIGRQWKVYASYNASLRMPSFTELYYSVGGHKADKYLKAEELRAIEGGVKYSSPVITAQASLFQHRSSNLIDWVMDTRDTEAVWQSVNLTKVNTLGFEVTTTFRPKLSSVNRKPSSVNCKLSTVNCKLSTVNIQLSYCYLHQQKSTSPYLQSQYALEYLRHKLTASLLLRLGSRFDLTLCYRFQDRRGSYTDVDGNVCNYRPYSIVDSRLAWKADTYSIYIEANNLTNRRYVDYGNVPQPGCWLRMGVNAIIFRNS